MENKFLIMDVWIELMGWSYSIFTAWGSVFCVAVVDTGVKGAEYHSAINFLLIFCQVISCFSDEQSDMWDGMKNPGIHFWFIMQSGDEWITDPQCTRSEEGRHNFGKNHGITLMADPKASIRLTSDQVQGILLLLACLGFHAPTSLTSASSSFSCLMVTQIKKVFAFCCECVCETCLCNSHPSSLWVGSPPQTGENRQAAQQWLPLFQYKTMGY